jgi:hypothetical protein
MTPAEIETHAKVPREAPMTSTLMQGLVLLAALVLGVAGDVVLAVAQQTSIQSDQDQKIVIWTATIPDAFPRNVYTWRLRPDGTYGEDGRDVLTGEPVQPTLSGRWTVDGTRMILRQDGIRYVFDGVVVGDRYSGTLYLGEQRMSRFCAVKGETVPQHCEAEAHTSVHNRVGPLA